MIIYLESNDLPNDIFLGEVGDDMSVPRERKNDTAPNRVACQSLPGQKANKTTRYMKDKSY